MLSLDTYLTAEGKAILDAVPSMIFIKNTDSRYNWGNKEWLSSLDLAKADELEGRTDFELPFKEYADKYKSDDELTLKDGPQTFIDTVVLPKYGKVLALSNKTPVYDKGGMKKAVFCSATFIPGSNLGEMLQKIRSTFKGNHKGAHNVKRKRFYYSGIYFTRREAQVLHYYLNGANCKKIAYQLNLSQKTVEYYLEQVKVKTSTHNREALIKAAFDMGFLDLMFYMVC